MLRHLRKRVESLKSVQVLLSKDRNSSIDVFRAVAILSVVIFHFNYLPFGNLGVDLFFVISGLLIGGILVKNIQQERPVNFFKFFIMRGFKIWPSYYVFIFLGSLLSLLFYSSIAPDQTIPLWDIKRYLFFYQNYTGLPFHWSFDHVWSLCVEEHFYILLPIMFVIIQRFFLDKKKFLFISVYCIIGAGILFKFLALEYTRSKDTYSATHNRIDALAWGVLLSLIIAYYPDQLRTTKKVLILFFSGLVLFIASIVFATQTSSVLYHKVFLHSIIPFSFFLMIGGAYNTDLSKFKYLRIVAYYSYNWYLWHPIFVIGITFLIGNNFLSLMIYLVITFLVAVLFTILIEEHFLSLRKKYLSNET
ncbi:MAG TPA: acyltransferase [Cyclobacteriaceae bacterium]